MSTYNRATFLSDLVAGLTVGVMLVPQGMAYAVLAGLPLIYGLYGGLVPLFLYAFFGTSRQLSVGPVAVSSVVLAQGLSALGLVPFSTEFVAYAISAGFFVGVFQFIFGLMNMGSLANFLSRPVIAGFTTAAAFIIFASQLGDFFGFKIDRELSSFEKVIYAFQHLDQTNIIALCLCLGAMILMLVFKKIDRRIPGALIVVVLGTLVSYLFNLPEYGLEIVSTIPEGLPEFAAPDFSLATLRKTMPVVLTVTIIGIIESIGIAKSIEGRHNYYTVRPNQELIAIGISKIGGAFFQAMPSSGSFTRSAVNDESGGRTTVSSLITFLLILLTLLFLTPAFYYLPKAILAAIILLAIRSLVEHAEAIKLWKYHRREFYLLLITFLVTLFLGIELGVLAGVILSIADVLNRSSHPHIAVLGVVSGKTYYQNINRFSQVKQQENALIVRFDHELFFANSSYFKDRINQLLLEEKREIKCFVLDANTIHYIDSSGLTALRDIHQLFIKKDIEFYICGAIGPVQDILIKSGLVSEIGEDHLFLSLHEGIEYYRSIN